MDQMRRGTDATGQMEGLDAFNAQALQILSDGGLADALDLSKENPRKWWIATLYHNLGIDLATAVVKDTSGRPNFLVDPGIQPIKELVG